MELSLTRTRLAALLGAGALVLTACGGGGSSASSSSSAEGASSSVAEASSSEATPSASESSSSEASSTESESSDASATESADGTASDADSTDAAAGAAGDVPALGEIWDDVIANQDSAESVRVMATQDHATVFDMAGATDGSYTEGTIDASLADNGLSGTMQFIRLDGVDYVQTSALSGDPDLEALSELSSGRWMEDDQNAFNLQGQDMGALLSTMDLSTLTPSEKASAQGSTTTVDGEDAYLYTMPDGAEIEVSTDRHILSVDPAGDGAQVITYSDWDAVEEPTAPTDTVTVEELQAEAGASASASR